MNPVTQQPGSMQFVLPGEMRTKGSCPVGLEYLAQIDQLVIKQQIELLELITGFETNNRYKIMNSMGQQVYFAQEETSCLMRQCCGPARGFVLRITDNNNQEVMRVTREFKCCAGCCWCAGNCCCAFEITIEAPVGTVIGYVRQECSCWKPVLGIYDENHQQLANVRGPCCVCNAPCCGDVEFPVMNLASSKDQETQVAMCAKQWSGMILEWITDADMFNVRFPIDMDPKIKATLFGAMFLIDFMFFEQKNNNN